MILLHGLVACSPWAEVREREAVWWGPTDRLHAEAGVELVPLPAGEPVGYWPRLVVDSEGVHLDNRAWFLSLPPELIASLSHEEHAALLKESRDLVPVEGGRISDAHRRGQLVVEVYEALLELATAHKRLVMSSEQYEFRGQVLIVAAPGTRTVTLRELVFTAGQAQYGRAGLAGAAEGRVRMASATDSATCGHRVLTRAVEGGTVLGVGFDRCALPPKAVSPYLEACRQRMEIDPGCTSVDVALESGTVDTLLPALATTYAMHPVLRPGYLSGGVIEEAPALASCSPMPPADELAAEGLAEICDANWWELMSAFERRERARMPDD